MITVISPLDEYDARHYTYINGELPITDYKFPMIVVAFNV